MTKAEVNNIVALIVSNLNKLLNTESPHEYFFLMKAIKDLLDELLEAKFREITE